MAAGSFEHASEARAALHAIVSDPAYGSAGLDNPQTLANLLGDLLPEAPRESGLLVAAATAGLGGILRGHVAQGLEPATAITLAAAALADKTAFTTDSCQWAAGEIAIALGLARDSDLTQAPPGDPPAMSPAAGPGQTANSDQITSTRPHDPNLPATLPPMSPPSRRSPVLAAGAIITVAAVATAVAAAVVLTRSPGSHRPHNPRRHANPAASDLVTRRPPQGGYTVSLPASWKFRNASYPSDHATHLWYDPANPLQRMQVVLSGCVGCADQNLNPTVPDPAQLVPPGATSRTRVSPWEERFRLYTNDDPYPDDGEIIVLEAGGQVVGFDEIQLWLPVSRRDQAAVILTSFSVPRRNTGHAAPAASSPRTVVRAYLAAINRRDWPKVWELGGKNLGSSYRQMVDGYRYTSKDVITSMTVRGAAVSVRILAYETTGAVQTYQLSYIVSGGTIVAGQQTLLGTSG